ncbi:MAG: N-acetylglucosamine related transporter, NagX, partial [uncultured Gemmatimonadetes bacterium]
DRDTRSSRAAGRPGVRPLRAGAPPVAGRVPRDHRGGDAAGEQPGDLERHLPAAGARGVARLDANGPDLPLLPLHRGRGDGVLARPRGGAGGATRQADGEGGGARGQAVRAGAAPGGVPILQPGPGAPAHPRRAAADRGGLRGGGGAGPLPETARPGVGHRGAPAGLLGGDEARPRPGLRRGRPEQGGELRGVRGPHADRHRPHVGVGPDLGPGGAVQHPSGHRHGAAGGVRGALAALRAPGGGEGGGDVLRGEPGAGGGAGVARRVPHQQGAVDQLVRALHGGDGAQLPGDVLLDGGRTRLPALVAPFPGVRRQRHRRVLSLRADGAHPHPGAAPRDTRAGDAEDVDLRGRVRVVALAGQRVARLRALLRPLLDRRHGDPLPAQDLLQGL